MITKYLTDGVWTDQPVRAQVLVGRKEVYLAEEVEMVLKEIKSFLTSMTLTQPHDPGDYLKAEAQALLAHLKEPT